MSSFALLLLCAQAYLIQSSLGVCYGSGPIGYGIDAPCELRAAVAGPYGSGPSCAGAYKTGLLEPFGYKGFADYGYKGFADYGYKGFADYGCGAKYGGSGIGNVAVAGELPVGGNTAVAGQVPIIGAVEYAGPVAAAGAVTIAGNCACGAAPVSYGYGLC